MAAVDSLFHALLVAAGLLGSYECGMTHRARFWARRMKPTSLFMCVAAADADLCECLYTAKPLVPAFDIISKLRVSSVQREPLTFTQLAHSMFIIRTPGYLRDTSERPWR